MLLICCCFNIFVQIRSKDADELPMDVGHTLLQLVYAVPAIHFDSETVTGAILQASVSGAARRHAGHLGAGYVRESLSCSSAAVHCTCDAFVTIPRLEQAKTFN